MLASLGGWPVIEKEWKPQTKVPRERLFGQIRGEYSEPVLIELFVGADDKNSSVNIFQVSGGTRFTWERAEIPNRSFA